MFLGMTWRSAQRLGCAQFPQSLVVEHGLRPVVDEPEGHDVFPALGGLLKLIEHLVRTRVAQNDPPWAQFNRLKVLERIGAGRRFEQRTRREDEGVEFLRGGLAHTKRVGHGGEHGHRLLSGLVIKPNQFLNGVDVRGILGPGETQEGVAWGGLSVIAMTVGNFA